MRLAATLLALSLVGCATSSSTYLPDGRKGYTINCSGSAVPWSACQKKAGDLCQAKGYDILSANGEQGSTFIASGNFASGGSTSTKSMLVACKP